MNLEEKVFGALLAVFFICIAGIAWLIWACDFESFGTYADVNLSSTQNQPAEHPDYNVTYNEALEKNDYRICGQIVEEYVQDQCYLDISLRTKNPSLCGLLKYPWRLELCEQKALEYRSEMGANLTGTPGGWLGCRGNGLAVCVEKAPWEYFTQHPDCKPNPTCAGKYYLCNENLCPTP
ncbi:MAG: hypothetical protein ABH950_01615 [Candidatus Altiarchaeota archaeon]